MSLTYNKAIIPSNIGLVAAFDDESKYVVTVTPVLPSGLHLANQINPGLRESNCPSIRIILHIGQRSIDSGTRASGTELDVCTVY